MPAARSRRAGGGVRGSVFAHLSGALSNRPTALDDLAADGVTCTVCHQIAPDGLGTRERFNGNFAWHRRCRPARAARSVRSRRTPDAGASCTR